MIRVPALMLAVVLGIAWGVTQSYAAPVFWVPDADGEWQTAGNWSSAPELPGADDDVTIDVGGTTARTIEMYGYQPSVLGLACEENLLLGTGKLTIGANGGHVNGDFSLTRGSLIIRDNGQFAANGSTTLGDGSLYIYNGGVLALPNLTEWNMPTSQNVSVLAEGKGDDDTGTLLDLSALTTITMPKYPSDFNVYAHDGAQVDLSALCLFDGDDLTVEAVGPNSRIDMSLLGGFVRETRVLAENGGYVDLGSAVECGSRCPDVQAIGWGSVIDLSSLGNCSCSSAYCDDCGFLVEDGGRIILPTTLTELDGSSLSIGVGTLPTAQLTRYANATLTVHQGATPSFASLTTLETATLRVRDGGVVQMPRVTALLNGGEFEAARSGDNGQRSLIDLSWVTNLDGYFELNALEGGKIDLSNATFVSPDYRLSVVAEGTGSVVDLSSLDSLVGTSTPLSFRAAQGGEIILPTTITEIDNVRLAIGNGTLPTAHLERILNSRISTSEEPSFAGLKYLYNTRLTVSSGGRLALPSLSTITMATDGYLEFLALDRADDGTPSRLDLSSITSFSGNSWTLYAAAEDGGLIDLSSLVSSGIGHFTALARGEGSTVDLTGLRYLSGFNAQNRVSLEAHEGGTILLSDTISGTFRYASIELSGGQMQLAPIKSIDDCYINASEGSQAEFTNLTSLRTPRLLRASTDGTLRFPALKTITMTDVGNTSYLWDSMHGGTLDLSSTTTISGNNWELDLDAYLGGTIDLSSLAAISGSGWRIDIDITYHDGIVDLGKLQSISGGFRNVDIHGENSLVDFSSLRRFAGTSSHELECDLIYDGKVKLHESQTTVAEYVTFNLDAGATIEAEQLKLGRSSFLNADSSTIEGSLLNSQGYVRPKTAWQSVGRFEITGDYIQESTGKLAIDFHGPSDYDQIAIGGDAVLAGILAFSFDFSQELLPNQDYPILLVGGTSQGTFSGRPEYSVVWTDQFGNDLFITYRGGASRNDVVLTTRPVPEPSTLILLGAALVSVTFVRFKRKRAKG